MNKTILTIVFCCALLPLAIGQLWLGPGLGMNSSKIGIDDERYFVAPNDGAQRNFYFGLSTSVQMTEKVFLQTDFQYSQKGFDLNEGFTFVNYDQRIGHLDVISVVEFRPIKFIGVGVGLNLSRKLFESRRFGGSDDWELVSIDNPTATLPFDLSGYALLRAYLGDFFVHFGYNLGFFDVYSVGLFDQNFQALGIATGPNRHFQIGVGYLFKLL